MLAIAAIVRQMRAYSRASSERRQQLKWLTCGGGICIVSSFVALFWSSAPAIATNIMFPLGLAVLPLATGVAILRYRL